MATTIRRRRYGPRRPGWSWWFESIQQMMARDTPSDPNISAEEIRSPLERVTAIPIHPAAQITPVIAGSVPGEWVTMPESQAERVIFYIHGGGYISGSPVTHRGVITQLARQAGARVLALDYRLAPEYPYPAAVEDVWTAYWWLLSEGVAPTHIAVAGDSAGGGLSIAIMLALRDAGMPLPATAVCFSPWFDLAMEGNSICTNATTDYLNRQVLKASARMYLNGANPHTPLASPLYADLHGLPPLLIQAGTAEMLVDDARRFALRAEAAGITVELELWDDMFHVWHFLYWLHPKARQAIDSAASFIRRYIEVES